MKEKYQVLCNLNSIIISIVLILFLTALLGFTSLCLAQGDIWTKKAPMPTARYNAAACTLDGKIYLFGGTIGSGTGAPATSVVEVYDSVSDTWSLITNMPKEITHPSACTLNGKIYIFGGAPREEVNPLSTVYEYNPVNNTWVTKAPMPTARMNVVSCAVGGKIYVIGGQVSTGTGPSNAVEEFDPIADKWTEKTKMPTARAHLCAGVVNDKIYAIGGVVPSLQSTSKVEEYNPATDTWASKSSMQKARTGLTASTQNGKIYVIGGSVSPGSAGLATVEEYDPLKDNWTYKTDMPTARVALTSSTCNGMIYALGGAKGPWPFIPLSINEQYTPPINSLAQIDWQRHPMNPILNVGSSGSWDAKEARCPAVIFDGSSYHCWYSGWDGASDWHIMIGYASSPDGLTWTKHPTPVLDKGPSGKFDGAAVLGCCVIQIGDTLKMWYQGWSGGYLDNQIGLATSPDGTNWTKYSGNPVLSRGSSGTWNSYGSFSPSVIFDGATYHIWYAGTAPGKPWEIGYATSKDGIKWTEHPNNPVLHAGSSGSWDSGVTFPTVLFDGTTLHMWYTGLKADNTSRIGYANSPDGINWTKADSVNPVLDLVPATWEQNSIELGSVIFDQTDSTYKMWYSGLQGDIWRIGYASAATTPVSVKKKLLNESKLPIEFALEQNYPNPFNPETRIKYQLALSDRVSLKVFNMLGKEIRTLVDEIKPAGSFDVWWDGKDDHGQRVASGVYLYRLESKDFIQTRKMIFLQ